MRVVLTLANGEALVVGPGQRITLGRDRIRLPTISRRAAEVVVGTGRPPAVTFAVVGSNPAAVERAGCKSRLVLLPGASAPIGDSDCLILSPGASGRVGVRFVDGDYEPAAPDPVLLLMVGLPGAGKSTFCEHLQTAAPGAWARVCQDSISAKGGRGSRAACVAAACAALAGGRCVVVDRTNVDAAQRADFVAAAAQVGVAAHAVVLERTARDCAARAAARATHEGGVLGPGSARVVHSMAAALTAAGPPDAAAEGLASVTVCTDDTQANAAAAAWAARTRAVGEWLVAEAAARGGRGECGVPGAGLGEGEVYGVEPAPGAPGERAADAGDDSPSVAPASKDTTLPLPSPPKSAFDVMLAAARSQPAKAGSGPGAGTGGGAGGGPIARVGSGGGPGTGGTDGAARHALPTRRRGGGPLNVLWDIAAHPERCADI